MWEIERKVSKGRYDYAVVPDHPDATEHGYVLYHRVVAENNLGRRLTENEVVHHLDEDTKNNDWENLDVLTREGHASLHGQERKQSIVLLRCPECREEFERERRKTHLVKDKRSTFCSRSCNGKFLHRADEEKEKRLKNNVLKEFKR